MITTLQFLLSLSILVVLHELGHFSAAKWFKTKVEKFYLFFNPGFSLFKKQIGETEYGIGWLPLGGYVKIAGMVDESFDMEQLQSEPQPWEFRSKPAWQRLIIMLGGVFVNFVLGVFLFAMILFVWGQEYIPSESVQHGIAVTDLGYELGLRDGDMVMKIGDVEFDKFNARVVTRELVINRPKTITLKRNGAQFSLDVDDEVVSKLTKYENKDERLFYARIPYVISDVTMDSPGMKAGIIEGDKVTGVNGEPTLWSHQFLKAMEVNDKKNIKLDVERDGRILSYNIDLNENGKIGILPQGLENYVRYEKEKYSMSRSIPAGWDRSLTFLSDQIKAFGQMFSGKIKAKDSLGSFITIGKMFGPVWNWENFWHMTASLSILLGFLNLLPIPALDGGYVMFLLFETITGKKIPDKVMEIATLVGFGLLVVLMIYALGLDISRLF